MGGLKSGNILDPGPDDIRGVDMIAFEERLGLPGCEAL
jgi:hypothetical protein